MAAYFNLSNMPIYLIVDYRNHDLASRSLCPSVVGYIHPSPLIDWLYPSILTYRFVVSIQPHLSIGYIHPSSLIDWLYPSILTYRLVTSIHPHLSIGCIDPSSLIDWLYPSILAHLRIDMHMECMGVCIDMCVDMCMCVGMCFKYIS